MQFKKFRIARYKAVPCIPENEGFRYCVDGVAQPYIRGRGLLGERFLLGNVHRDSDEMPPRLARVFDKLRSRAQPDPIAVIILDAKFDVDVSCLGTRHHFRDLGEVGVVRMKQFIEFANGETAPFRFPPQDLMH